MSKLFELMIAAGLIAVMLMAWNGVFVWAATPPQPMYGTATVDGDHGEWNLAEDGSGDFFAEMYKSANPNKDVLSKLYLRYDCSTNTLYALVLVESGHTIDVDAGQPGEEHYIKISGSKIVSDADRPPAGGPPDFEWIGLIGNTAQGWETSASLDPGTYNDLNVHTQVDDQETSAVEDRAIDLLINCGQWQCEPGDMDGADTLQRTGNTVSWDITNNSSHPLIIEMIEMSWPSDNGNLITVKLDSLTIFDQGVVGPPYYAMINSGWVGTLADRTIEAASGPETLEFEFENQAVVGTLTQPYLVLVQCFGQGCVDSIGEGEPTVITLSSFDAKSSAGGSVSPLWLGLVGLTVLVSGSLFWVKRWVG